MICRGSIMLSAALTLAACADEAPPAPTETERPRDVCPFRRRTGRGRIACVVAAGAASVAPGARCSTAPRLGDSQPWLSTKPTRRYLLLCKTCDKLWTI